MFSGFFSKLPKSTLNFEVFEKNQEPHSLFIAEIIDCKKRCYLNTLKVPHPNTYGESTC